MNECDYYLLTCDSGRNDLESVDDYEMGSFDLRKLWRGDRLNEAIPECVKIFLDEGAPADMLGNPFSWLLVSKRFFEVVTPLINEHVQSIPITVYKKMKPITTYVLANPLGTVDAIVAGTKTKDIPINQMIIDPKMVPRDRHMFRLATQPTLTVISSDLVAALGNKGLKGVAAYRLKKR